MPPAAQPSGKPPALSVAVVGDMPYGALEAPRFDAVIDLVNADASVAFVIHVGEIKGGNEPCDDTLLLARLEQIRRLRAPVRCRPGDNEWTDCHRPAAGRYLPTERLAFLRRHFFPDPQRSLGTMPLAVATQGSTPGFERFVENALLVHERVVFATVDVVGSGNDLAPWSGLDADEGRREPRADRLAERARSFGRPVLLVHGDQHELVDDRPWSRPGAQGATVPKLRRLRAYGSPRLHGVRIDIDPESADVFNVAPM
jgi:hypothetical protein